jgi:ubiquitin carboxyl-terminal hydrolase 4/11/15
LLPPSAAVIITNDPVSATTSKRIYPTLDDMDVESNGVGGGGEHDKVDRSASLSLSPVGVAPVAGRKRYASGLGNLGNTCFMNSSLQCLAHTEPLRRYFLSGDYEHELNRDNPLGTGGELATQFAYLLSEMWGVPAKRRNVMGSNEFTYANSSTSAVYPRSFKYCLGKHAEQFMGYDQHDSQELATYLLDALHEDTNRVTKKPYAEKPEQGEDEPDDLAAAKAWTLHLQREDSRVLENFMGLVKSRVQCCEEDCNRVSTTFDPFMYLSVPIPGATDRTMKVTFVPLDPDQRPKNISVTLSKTAVVGALVNKVNEQLVKLGICNEPIPLTDLCPVDVWSHTVYTWHENDTEIDRIRDTDCTFVYELRPMSEIRDASQKDNGSENANAADAWDTRTKYRSHRYKLDLETMTKLNRRDEWQTVMENYVQHSMFNTSRGKTKEERMQLHQKLENFIDQCHKETTEEESTGLKRARDESDADSCKSEVSVSPSDEEIQGLADRSDASQTFKNVKRRHDVAILEFCSNKLRKCILQMIKDEKSKFEDGVTISIAMKRPSGTTGSYNSTKEQVFSAPLIIRVPSSTTVYGLREELALRLSRSLKSSGHPMQAPATENGTTGESSAEMTDTDISAQIQDSQVFGSPAVLIMRQIPLSYDKKSHYKSNMSSNNKLGMLERPGAETDSSCPVSLVSPSDECEQEPICEVVGPGGTVYLDWPTELLDRSFDVNEYENVEEPECAEEDGDVASRTRIAARQVTTVSECIDKYCQMEQLEETEMWYCNSCKKHVRAWKQFHLFRAPPILIIHLKRFHYSATTHRRDKISALIDFPLEGLDLTNMFSHWTEGEKPTYDLYAVSNHYGGLGGGHYTAYTLSDDGSWCHFDDSRVTHNLDSKDVVTEAAYVLYYRRRDVPFGQDLIVETPATIVPDQAETATGSYSPISSIALVGDDDMVVEDERSDASSRTISSPMGSMDGAADPYGDDDFDAASDTKIGVAGDEDFPLQ